MKIAVAIARVLLGLMFTIFGLNGFLHFIPMPPPTGMAGQYMTTLFMSGYLVPVFALQLVAGILLLANQYVPLALVISGPIIVNILIYHVLMLPSGLPPALVALVLWLLVFAGFRAAFASLFARQVPVNEPTLVGARSSSSLA